MGWLIDLALAAPAEAAPEVHTPAPPAEAADHVTLMSILASACEGTELSPDTFQELLSAEDITDIEAGAIPAVPTLHAYALRFAEGIRSGRIALLAARAKP